jgi:undecaprenyl-diphosphatase
MQFLARVRQTAACWSCHPALWSSIAVLVALLAAYSTQAGQATWEVEATRGVQAASPWPMRGIAEFMTAIGNSPWFLITAFAGAAALLLARHRWLTAMLLTAVLLRTTSPLMKDLVDRPRPSPSLVDVADRLGSPSFPSGHVLGATLLYGVLIYAVEIAVPWHWLKRTLQAGLASMILLMGYARVELGEHWPVDVLGGWLIGLLMIAGLVWLHRRVDPGAAVTNN